MLHLVGAPFLLSYSQRCFYPLGEMPQVSWTLYIELDLDIYNVFWIFHLFVFIALVVIQWFLTPYIQFLSVLLPKKVVHLSYPVKGKLFALLDKTCCTSVLGKFLFDAVFGLGT